MHNYYQQKNHQFLKFSHFAWFYINIYTILFIMITKYLHTSYDWISWVLKIIQPISDFLLECC